MRHHHRKLLNTYDHSLKNLALILVLTVAGIGSLTGFFAELDYVCDESFPLYAGPLKRVTPDIV